MLGHLNFAWNKNTYTTTMRLLIIAQVCLLIIFYIFPRGEGVEPLCRGGQTELMIKVADLESLTFLQLGWSRASLTCHKYKENNQSILTTTLF